MARFHSHGVCFAGYCSFSCQVVRQLDNFSVNIYFDFLLWTQVKYPETVDEKHTVNTVEAVLVKYLVQCLIKVF